MKKKRGRNGGSKSSKGKGKCFQTNYVDGETPTEAFGGFVLPKLCPFDVEIIQPCPPEGGDVTSGAGLTESGDEHTYTGGAMTTYLNTDSATKKKKQTKITAPAIPLATLSDGSNCTTIGGILVSL